MSGGKELVKKLFFFPNVKIINFFFHSLPVSYNTVTKKEKLFAATILHCLIRNSPQCSWPVLWFLVRVCFLCECSDQQLWTGVLLFQLFYLLDRSFTLTQSVSIHCSDPGAMQAAGIGEQQLLKCFRNRIVPCQGHGFCTNDFGSDQTFAVVVAVWHSATYLISLSFGTPWYTGDNLYLSLKSIEWG